MEWRELVPIQKQRESCVDPRLNATRMMNDDSLVQLSQAKICCSKQQKIHTDHGNLFITCCAF